jgi:hypothetical protein
MQREEARGEQSAAWNAHDHLEVAWEPRKPLHDVVVEVGDAAVSHELPNTGRERRSRACCLS